MVRVSVTEAKAKLSSLIAAAEQGEEVVITKHGQTAARLVVDGERKPHRKRPNFGSLKGKVWIADDFDDPLPEEELELWEGWHDPQGLFEPWSKGSEK